MIRGSRVNGPGRSGRARLPEWIRVRQGCGQHAVKQTLRKHGIATVCEEARCPNRPQCFAKPTATFMILGSVCTRNCGFCAVEHAAPLPPDPREPERIAEAAAEMGLRYVVVTSVTRDDLPDGGAAQFSRTIRSVRQALPDAKIEVLTPDFMGSEDALRLVLDAGPDVFNHNMETVRRLYADVRPQADYLRSLAVLASAKRISGSVRTKSGFMLGLGEKDEEVGRLLADLRSAGCEAVTIGQYLRPAKRNLPVVEYIRPEAFEDLKSRATALGFRFVASGPLVRSSMNAEEMFEHA